MCPSSSTHITVSDVYTTGNLDVVVRGYGLFSGRSLLDAKPKSPSPIYNKGLNCLVVRECDLHHNHRTGEEIYRHYPSARRLSKDEEKDITEILGLKANSKHVHDLVRRYGKFVTLKDIQNLKTKVREETRMGLQDAQLVLDKLTDALRADQGACRGVVVDDSNTLAILYYESSHMTEQFNKFPEILFIDGTYNTNKLGMPLTCLMVEDAWFWSWKNCVLCRYCTRRCNTFANNCPIISKNRTVLGHRFV